MSLAPERVIYGIAVSVGGALLVIALWQWEWWIALLAATTLGMYAAGVASGGSFVPSASWFEETFERVWDRLAQTRRSDWLTASGATVTAAILGAPTLMFLVCAGVSMVHHANASDVCDAMGDYYAQESESAESDEIFDSAYFDAVAKVGSTARDYRGSYDDDVRSLGKQLSEMADGDGGGIQTIDVDRVNGKMSQLSGLVCAG